MIGPAIQASSEGQTFLKPVEVLLPFDPARLPVGTDLSAL